MRIISYNILDGGEGRADPLAEVILAQRADVVALVEADDADVVERIVRRTDMDVIRAEGRHGGAALLSRWPIVQSVNHTWLTAGKSLTRVLLEAVVRDPAGREWPVFVTHLHAHAADADEEKRMTELDAILTVAEPHRRASRPHLLVGDFNANSPLQQIDPAACEPATRDEWKRNGGSVPRRVVRTLLDAGYTDTLHAVRPDFAKTAGTFSTQFPGQRVDYIFAWGVPREQIKSAWVEYDRLAKYASDHFPVGAELDTGT